MNAAAAAAASSTVTTSGQSPIIDTPVPTSATACRTYPSVSAASLLSRSPNTDATGGATIAGMSWAAATTDAVCTPPTSKA